MACANRFFILSRIFVKLIWENLFNHYVKYDIESIAWLHISFLIKIWNLPSIPTNSRDSVYLISLSFYCKFPTTKFQHSPYTNSLTLMSRVVHFTSNLILQVSNRRPLWFLYVLMLLYGVKNESIYCIISIIFTSSTTPHRRIVLRWRLFYSSVEFNETTQWMRQCDDDDDDDDDERKHIFTHFHSLAWLAHWKKDKR